MAKYFANMAGAVSLALLAAACGDNGAGDGAATVAFDLDSKLDSKTFWDLPFPSDLRLTADGRIDFSGFPNDDKLPLVIDLLWSAADRKGFPVMPVAWFRFTDPATAPAPKLDDVIAASATSPVLLVDIDPTSPELGKLFPVVAQLLPVDAYTAPALIAVAPRMGTVLRANTKYAYVLQKSFAPDATVPSAFATLVNGGTPSGTRGVAAQALYAPLWPALAKIAVDKSAVLTATVFTTGDQVAALAWRSSSLRDLYPVTIDNLALATVDNGVGAGNHDGYCQLTATVKMPQFQTGTPPFNSDGRILLDANNVPIKQGELSVPLQITIPRGTMPTNGWPLFHYFHGSGGESVDLVDLSEQAVTGGPRPPGKGPGWIVAKSQIAAAAAALPLNPERLPGATDYQYLNINNLPAFPFTFQQGVIEQRLLLDALLKLRIPAATMVGCTGATLPAGATTHFFDTNKLAAGGHSMGGMYTNMIGAVEPRYQGFTPFGAGGFWPLMILNTAIFPGASSLLAGILRVEAETFTFAHPSLALLGLGWEIADPGASMARIARRPLDDGPPRHVYQPIGENDKYFPNPIFDAATLAYGNHLAGDQVWPETAAALTLDGLGVEKSYPVKGNRTQNGVTTTSVAVQYKGDGIADPHNIFIQLPAVKYQYRCFLETLFRDGTPTVFAPKAIDAACN
ncbi:MAG TPA: hypothetical protein PLF40_02605 [Kofleriaceae bacterium]|nr:hypothetical protein [Kofleriaceae bacterium]